MKRSILAVTLILSFFLTFQDFVVAAGSCHCTVGQNRATIVDMDTCSTGTAATCAGPQTALTCSCIAPVISPTTCGTISSPCCAGNICNVGLQCAGANQAGRLCLDQGQIDAAGGGIVIIPPTAATHTPLPEFNMCKFAGDQSGDCETCLGDGGVGGGVWTALGCIRFSPTSFIKDFMNIALGVAGGIALLLMIYGSFLLSVSTGDPKKAQEGKEIISGTIAGLLFIIFSVFLLKLIGVDILQIPGF